MAIGEQETAPLLHGLANQRRNYNNVDRNIEQQCEASTSYSTRNIKKILPLALLSGLGMSFTAATSVRAWAQIFCEDPRHCKNSESQAFAGGIAIASVCANVAALLSLGPLERLSRRGFALGILFWLVIRTMSPLALILGGMANEYPGHHFSTTNAVSDNTWCRIRSMCAALRRPGV